MPFTIAHPALVLPLKKAAPRWFSLTGLMAGAVAPDLIYFLLMFTQHRGFSHSWTGMVVFCIPTAIIFSFVFHKLFKYNFIINLPSPLDKMLSGLAAREFSVKSIKQWIIFISSVLVGILSHFFWDSFTHLDGEIVKIIPFLSEKSTIMGITRANCRFLQHLSTITGALFIPIFLYKAKLIPVPKNEHSIRNTGEKLVFWIIGLAVSLVYSIAALFVFSNIFKWNIDLVHNTYLVLSTFGLSGWAGFFYYVCIYAIIRKTKT
jgi:hypothetical protein